MGTRKIWSEEQIIGILKQVEAGRTVVEVCRENDVGESTFYKWRSTYGGLEVSEMRRLKALEDENARLKRLVAEQALDIVILKDINSKKLVAPAARRDAVRHTQEQYHVS